MLAFLCVWGIILGISGLICAVAIAHTVLTERREQAKADEKFSAIVRDFYEMV